MRIQRLRDKANSLPTLPGVYIMHDHEDAIIYVEGEELKAWTAIADYMDSFEDTDGDGTPNVPQVYGTKEGRKVVEDSTAIGDLIKNPNKFTFIIGGVVLVVLAIPVLLVIRFKKRKK